MNWLLLSRMLGLLGMLVGASMACSLPWAWPFENHTREADGFWGIMWSILCSLLIGGVLYSFGRRETGSILRKEALAIVGLGWLLAGALGSLPFLLSGTMCAQNVPMTIVDALFESFSGFTTTGASVLTDLEDRELVPRCVLFWRSFTHWLGGMGIIVLFVAILGQLGAAGKALMRREVPGPIAETVRPRVRETAMVMWAIYMVISFVLAIVLVIEGMNLFDALCHTFGTMATGGFSTYNASVGHFRNSLGNAQGTLIEGTLILFMIAAGTNFSLYCLILRRKDPRNGSSLFGRLTPLYLDPEFRVYLSTLCAASIILTVNVLWNQNYDSVFEAARNASFQVVAITTTTGFSTADFTNWSEFSKGLLLLLMFVGGSAGSTCGGIKIVRFILFAKVLFLEIEQAFRPNVVRPLRIAGVTIDNSLRHEVLVYFGLILFIFISSWLILAAIEPDTQWETQPTKLGSADSHTESVTLQTESTKLLDCASAVAATLNNIGPGLGALGPAGNYSKFSAAGKLLLTLLMLLGRLELFAILVLFVPAFWRTQ